MFFSAVKLRILTLIWSQLQIATSGAAYNNTYYWHLHTKWTLFTSTTTVGLHWLKYVQYPFKVWKNLLLLFTGNITLSGNILMYLLLLNIITLKQNPWKQMQKPINQKKNLSSIYTECQIRNAPPLQPQIPLRSVYLVWTMSCACFITYLKKINTERYKHIC